MKLHSDPKWQTLFLYDRLLDRERSFDYMFLKKDLVVARANNL